MRIGTYLGFAAGMLAGACIVSFNPKARQAVTEAKEIAISKLEEMNEGNQQQESPAAF